MGTLELANIFYESGITEWSIPNFIADIHRHDDPLYPKQWFLNNEGQIEGGVFGVDINAEEAWTITTGSSNIIVAVVDDGVALHEDFSSGQILPGFVAGGGEATPGTHGTAVAGIIATNHNSIGCRGVTTNARILPINIFPPNPISWYDIASAIDTAWMQGAHIINNSWGNDVDML